MIFCQIGVRKRLVFGTIGVFSLVFPAYVTTIVSVCTDIIDGMCVPCVAFKSYAAQQAMYVTMFLFTYALPTLLMVFCYSRIVFALIYKVGDFANLK